MADDREYEAGTPLDAEALAFAEKEGIAVGEPVAAPKPAARKAAVVETVDDDSGVDADAGDDSGDDAGGDDAGAAVADPKEDLALKMGWAPRDQWRGAPDQWVDAETFVERASPRMLLERINKLTKEHDQTFERVERVNKAMFDRQKKEFDDTIKALKKQRNAEVAQVAKERGEEAAAEHGDKWDEYIDKQKAPEGEQAKPAAAENSQAKALEAAQVARAWALKRPQYESDPVFQAAAHRIMDKLKDEMPNQFEAQFAELDKRLAATGRFADIYAKPANGGVRTNGNGAPPADGRAMDGVRITPKKTTSLASRLPVSARSIGERMVKRGDVKNLEAYAKEYFADE